MEIVNTLIRTICLAYLCYFFLNCVIHAFLLHKRGEVTLLRSERDKKVLEANFAKDQVDGLKKEIEHQVGFFLKPAL